ncbi:oligopeptidase A [Thiohalomonas denitrificans]|uniref:oligopeptidase A n=1 Tax=Thiohalomonas denitrificans TaxID=415747 RepID=A0A1G5QT64_9GAMM|nr:oligopeptidase A [Thiohalomonas denitrificans]SCZ64279.1 oligopeptidase A [Thiohalomonas denitrificans]
MPNPLLEMTGLPPFQDIRPEHAEPAVDTVLTENRATLESLLSSGGPYGWNNLVEPLEAMEDRLGRVFSPISHMNAVVNSEPLREAYNNCRSKISTYHTELGQNAELFRAFTAIAEGPEYQQLDTAQRKVIDDALRDFRLTGIDLPGDKQERFKAVSQELSRLTSRFDENLLDATHGWQKSLADEERLAGLPESAKGLLRQYAEREGLEGWLVTLEFPSYFAVMTHADDRPLREEIYQAFSTRASDRGPRAGQWDNSEIMEEILRLRHEQAELLGFANYAERSLATKMAESPRQVVNFLRDLASRSVALARHELDELTTFARERDGLESLQAWDIGYYAEKLRQARYDFSQEELKPYFPAERVVPGMFSVVKRLYGIDIREVKGVPVWHEDVRFYEIRDNEDQPRGGFYLDLYARPHKRGGAWMDECISRRRLEDGTIQNPVAFLTCNFAPPVGEDPALLTHDELTTLFHEFGHGLHHMLTRVDYADVSGINGVPWDAVELPSQFMENWCWEREAIDLFAAHYRTGEPLPEALFDKLKASRNFNVGMFMVRQLEFSLFDFRLHLEYDPARGGRIQEVLDDVRAEVAVVRPPEYNRFQHGFAHIFSGGYAAGYYSYKWAEVLSADAFSRFEEEGIFNRETGAAFLEAILEQGGARDPMELFMEFRGRKPQIDALLRHSGIAA